jgi:hypothetical protein
MVPNNVLTRTFRIAFNEQFGTAFTIDVEGKQYLITARHLVNEQGAVTIQVQHEMQWKNLRCNVIGRGADNADITVLAPALQLSYTLPLLPSIDKMALGMDVHFLGFPYGLQSNVPKEINLDFPLPLVKKACVSMFALQEPTGKYFLLDGQNNPGFSGGPVVFVPIGKGIDKVSVAGVISGFQYQWEPIYAGGKEVPLAIKYNTGIVIAYAIGHALDIIAANPIGFPLPH